MALPLWTGHSHVFTRTIHTPKICVHTRHPRSDNGRRSRVAHIRNTQKETGARGLTHHPVRVNTVVWSTERVRRALHVVKVPLSKTLSARLMSWEDVAVSLHTHTVWTVFISVTSVEGIRYVKQWRKQEGGTVKCSDAYNLYLMQIQRFMWRGVII